jgi:hypothetical protein
LLEEEVNTTGGQQNVMFRLIFKESLALGLSDFEVEAHSSSSQFSLRFLCALPICDFCWRSMLLYNAMW